MVSQNNRISKFAGKRIKHYRAPNEQWLYHPALRDGRFKLFDVPAMMQDPAIMIGLWTIYGPIRNAKFEVRADSKEVKAFIEATLDRFWQHDLLRVLPHYVTKGTAIGEVLHEKTGDLWTYGGLDDFDVQDVQAMRHREERYLTSVKVNRGGMIGLDGYAGPINNGAKDWNTLRHPKIFWASHRPLCGQLFGYSSLAGSWGSWMEKVGTGGAISIRRLWAYSNAFRGCMVKYPVGATERDGILIDNQDIARELATAYCTGAATTCPSGTDEQGHPLWEIIDPKLNGEIKGLMDYPDRLDTGIWQGMGVPQEVITAPDVGGSWSGRSGPLLIFLNIEDLRIQEIVTAFDVGPSGYTAPSDRPGGVIRPLVQENFGHERYQIIPISLVPKRAEPGAGGTGGLPGQGGQNPMGAAPGPEAMGNVATQPMGSNPIKLSQDAHGHEHKGKGPGGGQFASTGGGGSSDDDDSSEKVDTLLQLEDTAGDKGFRSFEAMAQKTFGEEGLRASLGNPREASRVLGLAQEYRSKNAGIAKKLRNSDALAADEQEKLDAVNRVANVGKLPVDGTLYRRVGAGFPDVKAGDVISDAAPTFVSFSEPYVDNIGVSGAGKKLVIAAKEGASAFYINGGEPAAKEAVLPSHAKLKVVKVVGDTIHAAYDAPVSVRLSQAAATLQQQGEDAYNEVLSKAQGANRKVTVLVQAVFQLHSEGWSLPDRERPKPYNRLEDAVQALSRHDDGSPQQRIDSWRELEDAARAAMQVSPVEPGWKQDYTDENRGTCKAMIKKAGEARELLEACTQHHGEMKAISLSMNADTIADLREKIRSANAGLQQLGAKRAHLETKMGRRHGYITYLAFHRQREKQLSDLANTSEQRLKELDVAVA